jgi:hypothetical protein
MAKKKTLTNAEFDDAHGDDGVQIGNWIYFADGARRTQTEQEEPPVDPAALHRQKGQYHQACMAKAANDQHLARNQANSPEERIGRFHAANGKDCILVDGWYLYSNAAKREPGEGAMCDPPTDPYERSHLQLRYREALLATAIKAFADHKQRLRWEAEANIRAGYAPPDADGLTQLETLEEAARARQRDVEKARAELAANIPESRRRAEALVNENRDRGQEFLGKLDEIKL